MTLDDLLAAYGTSLGSKPFAIDAQGVCELAIGERRIVIEPVPGEAMAQLWAVLGRLPPRHGRPGLYERLLAANLFGGPRVGPRWRSTRSARRCCSAAASSRRGSRSTLSRR